MDGCRSLAAQCWLRVRVRGLQHPKSGSGWSHGAGTASGRVGMSHLGSVLPSALRGGLSPSSARESLPAPAWGQTDVLHHVTVLGHPSTQLEVRTNLAYFTRISASSWYGEMQR